MIDSPAAGGASATAQPTDPDTACPVDDGETVCARGRRKLLQYSGFGGGALFVLIPNSELIHSAFRAVAGASVGYQCC
jgi:hypothetical protein